MERAIWDCGSGGGDDTIAVQVRGWGLGDLGRSKGDGMGFVQAQVALGLSWSVSYHAC